MTQVEIIADFPWRGDSLSIGVGNNGCLGGAEQELNALTEHLDDRSIRYTLRQSAQMKPEHFNFEQTYLVTNFWQLSQDCRQQLISQGNYIILENDYKFSPTRVVDHYPNNLVPAYERVNVEFYNSAKQILCISSKQKDIFNKNGITNTSVLGTSFWSNSELIAIDTIAKARNYIVDTFSAVYGYKTETKGTNEAINYCMSNGYTPVVIGARSKLSFLAELANCNRLVFLPLITESFSRITIEAYLLGLEVIFNDKVSAAFEPWVEKTKSNMTTENVRSAMDVALDTLIKYI